MSDTIPTWLKMDDRWRELNRLWLSRNIADILNWQSKQQSVSLVEQLNLPRYKSLPQVRLKDFLENPQTYLEQIPSSIYYISLIPTNPYTKRFWCYWKNWEDTISYLLETIWNIWEDIWNYDIIVREYYENIYWWSIIIKPDNFILEFKEWNQAKVARWTAEWNELMHITKWMLDSWFIYSFENEELRKTVFELIIKNIPHTLDWNHIDFTYMWYYEFAIWLDPQKNKLIPIFFDYKPNIII